MTGNFSDVLSLCAGGVRLTLRAKPGISRLRPAKIVDIGNGKRALEITVNAPPEDGKANQAIIERLADMLDVRKKDISLASGASGRLKIIAITGDSPTLWRKVHDWLGSL